MSRDLLYLIQFFIQNLFDFDFFLSITAMYELNCYKLMKHKKKVV